jgi:hypothetical protein
LSNGKSSTRSRADQGASGHNPRPSIDDIRLALYVADIVEGDTATDIDPPAAWREPVMLAAAGRNTLDRWIDANQDNPTCNVVGNAISWVTANPSEARDLVDQADAEQSGRFRLNAMTAADFLTKTFPREWLVKGLIVRDQPLVIGGPKKTLKTNTMVDLCVSLASSTPVLNHFEVPRRTRVLLISGESGEHTIQETIRRISKSKGLTVGDLDGLFVAFDLPRLNHTDDLNTLGEFIRENEIAVVVIDPLYLALLASADGGRRLDPANLFDMGPLLRGISRKCLECGATPILVHHTKKNVAAPYELPELEDLAFAGIQEFARQWLMLQRREPYQPGTGEHKLWLRTGGSAGHSGDYGVDVVEGVVDDDWHDRNWSVTVCLASEIRNASKQAAEQVKGLRDAEKDREREAKIDQDADIALAKLRQRGPSTLTKWRNAMGGWSGDRMGPVQERLLESGKIRHVRTRIATGFGEREVDAVEVADTPADTKTDPETASTGTTGTNRDEPGRTSESPGLIPNRDNQDDGGGGVPPLRGVPPLSSGLGTEGSCQGSDRKPSAQPGRTGDNAPKGRSTAKTGAGRKRRTKAVEVPATIPIPDPVEDTHEPGGAA